jgi:hypothetical protein
MGVAGGLMALSKMPACNVQVGKLCRFITFWSCSFFVPPVAHFADGRGWWLDGTQQDANVQCARTHLLLAGLCEGAFGWYVKGVSGGLMAPSLHLGWCG